MSTRREWASARTLDDLGQLTARWLEGSVQGQPGYCGRPAAETLPLVPVLAAACRAGYVTTGSQPGLREADLAGRRWEQRAAVEGLCSPQLALRLMAAAEGARLLAVVHRPWERGCGHGIVVTRRDGKDVTSFGAARPGRDLKDAHLGYGCCHRDAVKAACEALQVTLIDPVWGRQGTLWGVLRQATCDYR